MAVMVRYRVHGVHRRAGRLPALFALYYHPKKNVRYFVLIKYTIKLCWTCCYLYLLTRMLLLTALELSSKWYEMLFRFTSVRTAGHHLLIQLQGINVADGSFAGALAIGSPKAGL